jgi:hypothetical protein
MKFKHNFYSILISFVFLFIGCDIGEVNTDGIIGSGNVITVEKDFFDFTEVQVGHAFQTTIKQGNVYSISIRIDDNILDYLEVSKFNSRLIINLEEDNNYHDVTLTANIIMPNLDIIQLSGASSADISGFESDRNFSAGLSGASIISGSIICQDVSLYLSGASKTSLQGEGDDLVIEASGGSILDLDNFPCANISVGLSGASIATINTNGILNAILSGASKLYYYGNPTLGDLSVSGGSTIERL